MTGRILLIPLLLPVLACSGKDASPDSGTATGTFEPTAFDPNAYDFPSRFAEGSSVSHPGQTGRQLLIKDLKGHVGGLTARVDGGWFPLPGEVEAELEFYFSFDGQTSADVPFGFTSSPPPLQSNYGHISSSANLIGKIAGNDPVGQHADWSTAFTGWEDPAVAGPESLVRLWFAQLDAATVDRSAGLVPLDPGGLPVGSVALTAEGQDLQQLLEKFLHGAVSFSQAADDYLDDDEPDKGLLADNTAPDEGEAYTALEHAWDEGFGYFGAAHHYPLIPDATIADPGTDDGNADGAIDLLTEVCWGASANAAKRDLGAIAPTDFTADAWAGFYEGRALLARSTGALSAAELTELQGHRDRAIAAWEQALAATVVHYLNETLQDMEGSQTPEYDFAAHAKHWSEAKGFALAFQFNPRSPLSDGDFATLHDLLGTAPVLPDADPAAIGAYADDLRAARTLLADAYGFDAANLGDANGHDGW